MSGKGDRQRPTDMDKFNEGFDRIFGRRTQHTIGEDKDGNLVFPMNTLTVTHEELEVLFGKEVTK